MMDGDYLIQGFLCWIGFHVIWLVFFPLAWLLNNIGKWLSLYPTILSISVAWMVISLVLFLVSDKPKEKEIKK